LCKKCVESIDHNTRRVVVAVTMSEDGAKGGANLWQSMALGGAAASFAVNFTHPIVRGVVVLRVTVQFEQDV
jgi:hypothetical protein